MSENLGLNLTIKSGGLKEGVDDLDKVGKAGTKAEKSLHGVEKQTKATSSSFKALGVAGAAALTAIAGSAAISNILRSSKEYQGLNASLVTVTGSTKIAAQEFARISQFAKETPFQLAEVTSAFIKMESMGLKSSERALRSYGDTASSMSKSLNQMIEAVADAATGEFERLKEFGIRSSSEGDRVSFTFKGITTTVGKNAAEIEDYLMKLGETNFAGGMARQMDTIGGKLSNLTDSWDRAFAAIGASQSGVIGESVGNLSMLADVVSRVFTEVSLLDDITKGQENFLNIDVEEIARVNGEMSDTEKLVDDVAKAIANLDNIALAGLSTLLVTKVTPAVWASSVAFNAAMVSAGGYAAAVRAATVSALAFAATPIGAAITAAAIATIYLTTRTTDAEKATDRLTKSLNEQGIVLSQSDFRQKAAELEEYQNKLDYVMNRKRGGGFDVLGVREKELRRVIALLLKGEDAFSTAADIVDEQNANFEKMVDTTIKKGSEWAEMLSFIAQAGNEFKNDTLKERVKIQEKINELELGARENLLKNLEPENRALQEKLFALEDIAEEKKEQLAIDKENETQRKRDAQDALNVEIERLQSLKDLSFAVSILKLNTVEAAAAQAAYNAAQTGATPEQIQAIYDKVKALETEREAIKSAADVLKDYEKGIEDLDSNVYKIGDAWTETGNKAVDAINSMVEAMSDLQESDDKYAKKQEELNDLKKTNTSLLSDAIEGTEEYSELKADESKLTKEQEKLESARSKNSVKGSMQMMAASVSMYEEGSDAQKAAHTAFMAFRAIELASDIQKAISAATVAVATQGEGEPYSAWARIAAMSVMMGGLLSQIGASFSLGGGGGSLSSAGMSAPDGTPLGSNEASESVSNTLELMNDLEADQYTELQGIYTEMKDLNRNITGVVSSLYATGDLTGLGAYEGSYSYGNQDIVESINSLDKMLNPATGELGGGLVSGALETVAAGVFGSTSKSVSGYGAYLPDFQLGDNADLQKYTTIKKSKDGGWGRKSSRSYSDQYGDISGQSEVMMQRVFENMRDSMIGFGELLDMNVQSQVDSFVVSIGKIATKGKTAAEVEEAFSQAISGQADKLAYSVFDNVINMYAKVNESALDTVSRLGVEKVITEDILKMTEQALAPIESVRTALFGMKVAVRYVDADIIAVSQALVGLAGGIEELKSAADNYFEAFFSEQEQFDRLTNQLTSTLENVNQALPDSREGYRALVEGLNLTTDAGQRAYVALLGASDQADEYYSNLEDAAEQIAQVTGNLKDRLLQLIDAEAYQEELRRRELDTLTDSQKVLQERIWSLEDEASAQVEAQQALAKAQAEAQQATDSAFRQLQNSVSTRINALNEEGQAVQGSIDNINALSDTLETSFKSIYGTVQTEQASFMSAQKSLFDAVSSARSGNLPTASELSDPLAVLSANSANRYATMEDFQRDQRLSLNSIKELESFAGKELSTEQLTLDGINTQVDQQEAMLAQYQEQINTLRGINTSVISVEAAIRNVDKALVSEKVAVDANIEANASKSGFGSISDIYNSIGVDPTQNQLDIWERTGLSGQELVDAMAESITPHEGRVAWKGDMEEQQRRKDALSALDGSHATGLDFVPYDGYRAELHKGEMVVPAGQSDFLRSGAMISELKQLRNELSMLRNEQSQLSSQIVRNTGSTSDTLDRWEAIGQPEVRV